MASRRSDASAAVLRRLFVLARDLLQAPDFKSILLLVGPVIHELVASDGALLLVMLGNKESVTEFDHRGVILPAGKETALLKCAREVMNRQEPLLLPSVAGDSGTNRNSLSAVGITSLLAIPFPPVRPVGALTVFWNKAKGQQLTKRSSIVWHIAELTGAALGNMSFKQDLEGTIRAQSQEIADAAHEHAREIQRRDQVEEEIRHISVTDVLTGMQNRRGFFLQAEQSFKVAQRQGLTSALIFADIDGLKTINDKLGHDEGDHLIQDSAQVLHDSFRASDVVARLGGDEFAAFTVDAAQPEVILSRIRDNIEDFNQHSSRPYEVSFSTGIVQCDPSSHLTLSDYLVLADEKMYAQKKRRHH